MERSRLPKPLIYMPSTYLSSKSSEQPRGGRGQERVVGGGAGSVGPSAANALPPTQPLVSSWPSNAGQNRSTLAGLGSNASSLASSSSRLPGAAHVATSAAAGAEKGCAVCVCVGGGGRERGGKVKGKGVGWEDKQDFWRGPAPGVPLCKAKNTPGMSWHFLFTIDPPRSHHLHLEISPRSPSLSHSLPSPDPSPDPCRPPDRAPGTPDVPAWQRVRPKASMQRGEVCRLWI